MKAPNGMPMGSRWYRQIPAAMIVFTFMMPILMVIVVNLDPPIWIVMANLAIFVTALCWFTWLTPWLSAGDRRTLWIKPPRMLFREHMRAVWTVPAGLMAGGVVVLLIVFAKSWWERDSVEGWIYPTCTIVVGAGALMAAVSYPIWRSTQRRFRENLLDRFICFDCGYDLRGNPDATACPECGWAIAWKKVS